MDTFGQMLRALREKAGLSHYRLQAQAHVDESYIRRLERGLQTHPSRRIVIRLGQGLLDSSSRITIKNIERLLKAAGHEPLQRKRIVIEKA